MKQLQSYQGHEEDSSLYPHCDNTVGLLEKSPKKLLGFTKTMAICQFLTLVRDHTKSPASFQNYLFLPIPDSSNFYPKKQISVTAFGRDGLPVTSVFYGSSKNHWFLVCPDFSCCRDKSDDFHSFCMLELKHESSP